MRIFRWLVIPILGIGIALGAFFIGSRTVPEKPAPMTEAGLGHELATYFCAGCHAIEPQGDSLLAAAPPFRTLHERYDVSLLEEALVEGIVTAHPEMPQFEFEPSEAEAIIAYLKSLER